MSSLQFLAKKSWHTATIRNTEKVWLKEQEAAKEKARIEELQKQLEEERKLEEVQRLELESGRLDPAEVLKRRRLNWMYEHGSGKQDDEARKKKDEQEREDVMLGKKEIDLEKLSTSDKLPEETALVDVESKMREDPLFVLQKEQMRAGQPTIVPPRREKSDAERERKYTSEELVAKLKRKEERREIREERRRRREDRASRERAWRKGTSRKRSRHELEPYPSRANGSSGFERDGYDRRRRFADDSDRERGDVKKVERRYYSGHNEVCERDDYGHKSSDGEERNERSGMTPAEGALERSKVKDSNPQRGQYGLHIPAGGTGVAVTKEFVPRRRDEEAGDRPEQRPAKEGERPFPSRVRRPDPQERKKRLREMKENALRLERQRRERVEQHTLDMVREERDMERRARRRQDGEVDKLGEKDPANAFARDAIAHGTAGSSAAGRIQQRRAWATRDSDAAY